MKALVYLGTGKKALQDVAAPKLQDATDAIVRMTHTTICGSDLHILKGDVPEVTPGRNASTKQRMHWPFSRLRRRLDKLRG